MKYTREELVQKLRSAGLTVSDDCEVINSRDGYAIGFVELKQWSFKEPVLYEIEKLYCSDERYVFTDTGFGMLDQMFNDYRYNTRFVKKNDLDGFVAVCKEFIEWINAKYPREEVLKKEEADKKTRQNILEYRRKKGYKNSKILEHFLSGL